MAKIRPIPEGYHSVTPGLNVKGADKAIEFYKKAFGAEEKGGRFTGPDGKIMHAEIKIGDSVIMLSEVNQQPESRASLWLYVNDCDVVFKNAVTAGATVKMPIADQFWGDRFGQVTDPFGQIWSLATHKEDVSPEEMEKRGKAAMAAMGPKK
jgi:PhnB protein